MELREILSEAVQQGASDVHLKVGMRPMVRINGQMTGLDSMNAVLTKEALQKICTPILSTKHQEDLFRNKEIDIAYSIPKVGRFRVNVFFQRGSLALVIRNIPYEIKSLKELLLPMVVEKLSHLERGLVLFTGETGSGKSTSLASFVNTINQNYSKHIITIEDPIEYLIPDNKSVITQREVGVDTKSFQDALRASLRQDPDIILIGELRDAATVETALMASETGHLVISTLHTTDTTESILRILSYFEPHRHNQIQFQLASNLKAVISQRLIQHKNGNGYVPAVEVMVVNDRIKECILDLARLKEIYQAIEESNVSYGMQSFDQSLIQLLNLGLISKEEALKTSSNPSDFKLKLDGIHSWSRSGAKGPSIPESGDATATRTLQELQLETVIKKSDPKLRYK